MLKKSNCITLYYIILYLVYKADHLGLRMAAVEGAILCIVLGSMNVLSNVTADIDILGIKKYIIFWFMLNEINDRAKQI